MVPILNTISSYTNDSLYGYEIKNTRNIQPTQTNNKTYMEQKLLFYSNEWVLILFILLTFLWCTFCRCKLKRFP